MYSGMKKVIKEIVISFIIFISLINSVSATVELTDFFSDFTTSEVTVNPDRDFQGNKRKWPDHHCRYS